MKTGPTGRTDGRPFVEPTSSGPIGPTGHTDGRVTADPPSIGPVGATGSTRRNAPGHLVGTDPYGGTHHVPQEASPMRETTDPPNELTVEQHAAAEEAQAAVDHIAAVARSHAERGGVNVSGLATRIRALVQPCGDRRRDPPSAACELPSGHESPCDWEGPCMGSGWSRIGRSMAELHKSTVDTATRDELRRMLAESTPEEKHRLSLALLYWPESAPDAPPACSEVHPDSGERCTLPADHLDAEPEGFHVAYRADGDENDHRRIRWRKMVPIHRAGQAAPVGFRVNDRVDWIPDLPIVDLPGPSPEPPERCTLPAVARHHAEFLRQHVPERQAGAVAAAHALSWSTPAEATQADADAIAAAAQCALGGPLSRVAGHLVRTTPQHLAGAADFFHRLAHALHGVAAGMQGAAGAKDAPPGFRREGDIAVCVHCGRAREGTISWALEHARSCKPGPAPTDKAASRMPGKPSVAEQTRTWTDIAAGMQADRAEQIASESQARALAEAWRDSGAQVAGVIHPLYLVPRPHMPDMQCPPPDDDIGRIAQAGARELTPEVRAAVRAGDLGPSAQRDLAAAEAQSHAPGATVVDAGEVEMADDARHVLRDAETLAARGYAYRPGNGRMLSACEWLVEATMLVRIDGSTYELADMEHAADACASGDAAPAGIRLTPEEIDAAADGVAWLLDNASSMAEPYYAGARALLAKLRAARGTR